MQLKLFDNEQEATITPDICFDYFILISPPLGIIQKVRSMKHDFDSVLKLSSQNLFSVPHITLHNMRVRTLQDEQCITLLETALRETNGFFIKIKGIQQFLSPDSNSVVLKIEPVETMTALFNTICATYGYKTKKGYHPHLTIARKLSNNDLLRILPFVNRFDYHDEFLCDRISLLRRTVEIHPNRINSGKYCKVAEIRLK